MNEQEFVNTIQQTFQDLLEIDVEHIEENNALDEIKEKLISVIVHFTGDEHGVLKLTTSHECAYIFAGLMLFMEEEELVLEDVQDSFGEILNIIAGNLKTYIFHSCNISIPSFVNGKDYAIKFPKTERLYTSYFKYKAHTLRLDIMKQE